MSTVPSSETSIDRLVRRLYGAPFGSRSKTGDESCSRAAQAWAKRQATAATHKELARCRALAGTQRAAQAQRGAGQEARAQHLEHRIASGGPLTAKSRREAAVGKMAERVAKQGERRAGEGIATRDKIRAIRERVEREQGIRKAGKTNVSKLRHADQIRQALDRDPEYRKLMGLGERPATVARPAAPETAPGEPAPSGFALKHESAVGTKATTFESTGGKTHFMFDMKKGDLPGQTSLLEQVSSVETHPQAEAPTSAQMARHLPQAAGGSPAAILGRVEKAREARRRTAERLQKLRGASRTDPAARTDHPPGTVTHLNTDLIHFDPGRFQYKLDVTDLSTGSVGSLAGVRRWDPELAGIIGVWKDPADGRTYVVNGHNRLDLARKLGAGRVAVMFLNARDAGEARAKGALTNIAEGKGTVIDAAKFFRSSGITSKADLEGIGVPMGEAKARQGLDLAGLADPLFRRVIDGSLTPNRGAIIGGAGLTPDQQMKVSQLAERSRPGGREITDAHLKEIVDEVRHAPTRIAQGGGGLFGDDPEAESLALHRTALTSHVKERLARERRLFGTVGRQRAATELARGGNVINIEESGRISQAAAEALDTFDRLKRSAGPVSAALNRATERLATARGPADRKQVQDALYEEILGAVQQAHRLTA